MNYSKRFIGLFSLIFFITYMSANDIKAVVTSNNAFASDLCSQLTQQPENTLFSPYSITTVLAMAYAGAEEETEQEMAEALHINLAQDSYHKAYAELQEKLKPLEQNDFSQLTIANKIFVQKDFAFLPSYKEILNTCYDGAFESVDFIENRDEASEKINSWVSQKTNDKIKTIVTPRDFSPNTRMTLVNAIHFKGLWKYPFSQYNTTNSPFYCSKETNILTPMMEQTRSYNYMENDLIQLIELPFKNSSLSMFIILPKASTLSSIEPKILLNLDSWILQADEQEVCLFLPKFTIDASYELIEPLASIGMPQAFLPAYANFSGITGRKDLYITHVLHNASITIEEKGAEAGATTAAIMDTKSMFFTRSPQAIFNANHPFFFVIRDTNTNLNLFMGHILTPNF